ncbi:O-fucosyltransferase family protein [Melia azedarach]|uniref:O-fucosyltransferase family protein n=1 Tax=Melia azedarach TaxID=155640 RepID=A0ACC1XML4_MELAZ|nr:O-fucosyltransferase family protein [Melia azedarach]
MKNIFPPPKPSKPWNSRRKPQLIRSHFIFLSITLFTLLLLCFIVYSHIPKSLLSFSSKTLNSRFPPCQNAKVLTTDQKFLFYAPHSGFSNQLQEFKNAILMAGILNRTLIVPPVLDHHAIALGSCPKFRVLSPNEIRIAVWDHLIDLLQSGRYVSIADIVDISSVVSASLIQVIDFRDFVSLWCGVDIDLACSNDLNTQRALFDSLKQCGSTISVLNGRGDECLYAVDEDCRTTVWTYQNGDGDGKLDSFQPDEQLKKKKKISFVRRRQDVYKALGPGSKAELATVLAFGSLFTAPYRGSELYIDITVVPKDQRIQSLIKSIEFISFVPEILSVGKRYAVETIKAPFLCAQLRLLDGQFKNHWKTTFLGLKQKLDSLRHMGSQPVHIFVMTDLPEGNWTGNYLGDLAKDTDYYKLYFLREENELVTQTAQKLVNAGQGLRYGSIPRTVDGVTRRKKICSQRFSDVLLYIEETVCSCASLGFVGTAGSTIAESIELMRKFDVCSKEV